MWHWKFLSLRLWALWYWFLFINKCTPSPVALNIPFTQIVGLLVLVSFHEHMHRGVGPMVLVSFHDYINRKVGLIVLVSSYKQMHTKPCGTELSFLSEGWALWYWFLFIKKCTPSPVALNFLSHRRVETNTIRRTIWVKGIFSATGLGVHLFMKRNQYHKAHNLSERNIQCHRAGCAFIYEKKTIP